MNILYAVVYGLHWDQVCYFTDYDRARTALVFLTMNRESGRNNCLPFMCEHVTNGRGMLVDSGHVYDINPAFLGMLQTHSNNLRDAFDYIRLVENHDVRFAGSGFV